jgi:hypothetical protein
MRQDWSIPPFEGQLLTWAKGEFYAWNENGLGGPSYYPNDWIILCLYAIANFWIRSDFLSKLTLVAVVACATFGVYGLLRSSFRVHAFAAITGAVFYGVSPVIYNKIVSGQLAYLWGYALLPVWYRTYREAIARRSLRLMIASAFPAALMSCQLQFIPIAAIVAILDLIIEITPASAWAFLTSFGGIFVAQLGTIVALIDEGQSLSSEQYTPGLDWVQNNSASWPQALSLSGYVTHYFEIAWGWPDRSSLPMWTAAAVLILLLFFAAIAVRNERRGRFAIALYLIGAFLAAGINAPSFGAIGFLYAHVRALEAFREVYHWSVLAALGAALLLALLVERVAESQRLRWLARLPLFVALLYCWPSFTGNWAGAVQTLSIPAELRMVYDDVQRLEGTAARTAWLPIDQPLLLLGSRFSGVDPMAHTMPPSLWEYILEPPVSQIAVLIRYADGRGLPALLRYAAVEFIAVRHQFVSEYPKYAYQSYPIYNRLFRSQADLAGMPATGFHRISSPSNDVTIYRSAANNSIIAAISGYAAISPDVDDAALVPKPYSPSFGVALPHIDAIYADGDDLLTLVTPYLHRARPLLSNIVLSTSDAERGWSNYAGWIYYNDDFTKVFDAGLLSLRGGQTLSLGRLAAGRALLLSYVRSSSGGNIIVSGPRGFRQILPTRSPHLVLCATAIPITVTGRYRVLNGGGEELIRNALETRPSDISSAMQRFAESAIHAHVYYRVFGNVRIILPSHGLYDLYGIDRIDGGKATQSMALDAGVHNLASRQGGWIESAQRIPAFIEPRLVYQSHHGFTFFAGSIPAGVSGIALRESYSPGWTLTVNGRHVQSHARGELFGNAWTFTPSTHKRTFVIMLGLARDVAVARFAGIAVFSLLGAALVISWSLDLVTCCAGKSE